MLLTPCYGDHPVVSVELPMADPHPLVGQRRRLESLLRGLSDEQWQQRSRCEGWTVQDVITHLNSTNAFWGFSIAQGLAGEPTRFLATFDPVSSPAELVEQVRGTAPSATLEEFASGTEALAQGVAVLGAEDWNVLAEAPPGHLRIREVADHALWDAWVHERDVALPLGLEPTIDADEVLTCLHYAVALGRAFALCQGSSEQGSVTISVADPVDRFVVDVGSDQVRVHAGAAAIEGRDVEADAVTLLEVLSRRDAGWPEPPAVAWLSAGLAEVFDEPSVA